MNPILYSGFLNSPLDKKNIVEKPPVFIKKQKQKPETDIPMSQKKEYIEKCEKCGNEKIINISCVVCNPLDDYSLRNKEYYLRNKDKIIARAITWCKNNKKRFNEIKSKYRKENRDSINEKARGYYLKDRDKRIEQATEWYQNNRERANKTKREYRKKNREKFRELNRKYYREKKLNAQI